MELQLSPKYLLRLANEINNAIWRDYTSYKEVGYYIKRWYKYDERNDWENFRIEYKEPSKIDLLATLNNIDGELLIKMAIDLGIPTPGFIPCIPEFENLLKNEYENSHEAFTKAFKEVNEHPDLSIALANSTLEGIIKEILKDDRVSSKLKGTETLYDLSQELLKILNLFPTQSLSSEYKVIGSSLLKISQQIEKIRSTSTRVHGASNGETIVKESIYSTFIVNSIATVGLFLENYYKSIFPKSEVEGDDDLPF